MKFKLGVYADLDLCEYTQTLTAIRNAKESEELRQIIRPFVMAYCKDNLDNPDAIKKARMALFHDVEVFSPMNKHVVGCVLMRCTDAEEEP